MSFATVAAVVGVGTSLTGLGLSLSGALTPGQPNLANASKEMVDAQNKYLPKLDAAQAAAEEGTNTLKSGFTQSTAGAQKLKQLNSTLSQQQAKLAKLTSGPQTPSNKLLANELQTQIGKLQGQISAVPPGGTIYLDSKGNVVPESTARNDFTGYSTADIQGQLMKQLAAGQLATDKQYDPQFIAANLAEEQQANPQGVAARSAEFSNLENLVNNPPTSPVANEMERQIQEKVNAGSGLTPEEQSMLDKSVNSMGDIAGGTNGPDYSQALTTGFAGTQRALNNTGAGAQFLASGETPDDINYRANQQAIGDLSQFYSGQTPQSQFKSLTGAQSGATPISQSAPLPGVNNASWEQGANAGLQGFEAQLQGANPWLAGLGAAAGLAGTGAAAFGGNG